jgi:hypothetical protein
VRTTTDNPVSSVGRIHGCLLDVRRNKYGCTCRTEAWWRYIAFRCLRHSGLILLTQVRSSGSMGCTRACPSGRRSCSFLRGPCRSSTKSLFLSPSCGTLSTARGKATSHCLAPCEMTACYTFSCVKSAPVEPGMLTDCYVGSHPDESHPALPRGHAEPGLLCSPPVVSGLSTEYDVEFLIVGEQLLLGSRDNHAQSVVPLDAPNGGTTSSQRARGADPEAHRVPGTLHWAAKASALG